MRVLIVEDHLELAALTGRLLEDVYGHEVALAATGAEAIEKFVEGQPELVLVDIYLPDMDGFDLARRIRRLPGGESRLVVALTGFASIVDNAPAEAADFDAYFRKPMDFDQLPAIRRRSHAAANASRLSVG